MAREQKERLPTENERRMYQDWYTAAQRRRQKVLDETGDVWSRVKEGKSADSHKDHLRQAMAKLSESWRGVGMVAKYAALDPEFLRSIKTAMAKGHTALQGENPADWAQYFSIPTADEIQAELAGQALDAGSLSETAYVLQRAVRNLRTAQARGDQALERTSQAEIDRVLGRQPGSTVLEWVRGARAAGRAIHPALFPENVNQQAFGLLVNAVVAYLGQPTAADRQASLKASLNDVVLTRALAWIKAKNVELASDRLGVADLQSAVEVATRYMSMSDPFRYVAAGGRRPPRVSQGLWEQFMAQVQQFRLVEARSKTGSGRATSNDLIYANTAVQTVIDGYAMAKRQDRLKTRAQVDTQLRLVDRALAKPFVKRALAKEGLPAGIDPAGKTLTGVRYDLFWWAIATKADQVVQIRKELVALRDRLPAEFKVMTIAPGAIDLAMSARVGQPTVQPEGEAQATSWTFSNILTSRPVIYTTVGVAVLAAGWYIFGRK